MTGTHGLVYETAWAGEVPDLLSALAAPVEDLDPVPNTYVRKLRTDCNSNIIF